MKYLKSFAAVAVVMAMAGCDQLEGQASGKDSDDVVLDTQQKKLSYLAGMDFASNFRAQGVALDADSVAAAIRDSLAGTESRLSEEEVKKTVDAFQQDMLAKQQALAAQQEETMALAEAEFEKVSAENLKVGAEFLAENGAKEGVVTLDSGLQYKVVTEGEGPKPSAADTVEVHYRGSLIDGTEFDSSYKRDIPAKFRVNEVLPGWVEALQLMPEGSKWELYIPGDLAYGPGGTGKIGPNALLIFEVELLKSKVEVKAEAETETTAAE